MRLIVNYSVHVESDRSLRNEVIEFQSMEDVYVKDATLTVNHRNRVGQINLSHSFPLSSIKNYYIEPSGIETSLED